MRALADRSVPIFAFEPIREDLEKALFWTLAGMAETPREPDAAAPTADASLTHARAA